MEAIPANTTQPALRSILFAINVGQQGVQWEGFLSRLREGGKAELISRLRIRAFIDDRADVCNEVRLRHP